jgi:hypothetical protein
MINFRHAGALVALLALALVSTVIPSRAFAQASPFALEVTNIKPAGTGNPAIPATNRIFHAYPGLEYNIRAGVIGGTYPYKFSLSNAPAGMVVNADTGEISWPNPAASAGPITLTVVDSIGASVQASWSISVHTTGFWFVNGDYTGTSTGSLTQPFKTLLELLTATQGKTGDIVYLRKSTSPYMATPYPGGGSGSFTKTMFISLGGVSQAPETMLAYPGEAPVIDLQNAYSLQVERPYFDGITIKNGADWIIIAKSGASYKTLRRMTLAGVHSTYAINDNQGGYFVYDEGTGYYDVLQDNDISGFVGAGGIGSLYNLSKILIENNHTHDGGAAGLTPFAGPIGLKHSIINWTMRGNIMDIPAGGRRLELYDMSSGGHPCDFSYNLLKRADSGLVMQWYDPDNAYVYRNTIIGDISFVLPDVSSAIESSTGPFYFKNNVIQGTLTYATYVTEQNDLKGSFTAGFVDSRGNLTGSYVQYLGLRGYQLGSSTAKTPVNPGSFLVK